MEGNAKRKEFIIKIDIIIRIIPSKIYCIHIFTIVSTIITDYINI